MSFGKCVFVALICLFSSVALSQSAQSSTNKRVDVAVLFQFENKLIAWPMFSVSPNGTIIVSSENPMPDPYCKEQCEIPYSAPVAFYALTTMPSRWFDKNGGSYKSQNGYYIKEIIGGPDTVLGFLLSDRPEPPKNFSHSIALSSHQGVFATSRNITINKTYQFPELRTLFEEWKKEELPDCEVNINTIYGSIAEYVLASGRRLQYFTGGLGPAISIKSPSSCDGNLIIDVWKLIEIDGTSSIISYDETGFIRGPFKRSKFEFWATDCVNQCPGEAVYEVLEINGAVFLIGEGFRGTAGGFGAMRLEGDRLIQFLNYYSSGT